MAGLIYILAASHSGSTLLAMLLGSQRGVFTAGELKASALGDPDSYRCSCGLRIRECGFWHGVAGRMVALGYDGFEITRPGTDLHAFGHPAAARLLGPLHRGSKSEWLRDMLLALVPGWKAFLGECRARNLALIKCLSETSGAQWIVDSSKTGLRLKYLMGIPGMEVRVIRLIRDGRAVAMAYTNEWEYADAADPALRGGGGGTRRGGAAKSMADAANEWRRSNEEAEMLLAALPAGKWMEVRYEELCGSPRETMQRLGGWLGLGWEDVNLDYRGWDHHVIGNGMRMDTTSRIVLDDRWRRAMDRGSAGVFDRVAGELNRRYGYG